MPYQIKKEDDSYYLYKLKDGTRINKKFKSKQSAVNMGFQFMRYRKEEPYLKGNKILNKKKKE